MNTTTGLRPGAVALCWVIWPGGARGFGGRWDQESDGPRTGLADTPTEVLACAPPLPASILTYFRDLPDPRRETRNKKHRLIDILVIALCGTIAGCQSAVEIAAYGRAKASLVEDLPGAPQRHPLPRHLLPRPPTGRSPASSTTASSRWVQALHELTRGQVVPIDGKTLRRSFDSASDLPALHLVSAWAAEDRLVLGEIPVDDKSNEITAMPKLLEILELTGAIVTIDAMGCQKEIAAKVREQGGRLCAGRQGQSAPSA